MYIRRGTVEKDPDYMLDEQRDEAVFELIQA